MYCIYCGTDNPAGARFCQNCGRELLEDTDTTPSEERTEVVAVDTAEEVTLSAEQPTESAKKHPKMLAIAMAVVTVLTAMALMVWMLWPAAAYGKPKVTLLAFYDTETNTSVVLADDRVVATVEDNAGSGVNMVDMALDGTASLLIRRDERVLYYISEKGAEQVTSNPRTYALSADGSTVAYITVNNRLMLRDFRAGREAERVADRVLSTKLVISTDGSTVMYVCERKDSGMTDLYAYNDGKEYKLGQNLTPIAASSKGRYLYVRSGSRCYVMDLNGEKTPLSDSPPSAITLNRDGTQAMISTSKGSFLSAWGGEVTQVADQKLQLCTPQWTRCHRAVDCAIYDVDDLYGKVWEEASGKIYLVDQKAEAHKLAEKDAESPNVTLSGDGETLYYVPTGGSDLYAVGVSVEVSPQKLADGVSWFAVSPNGKYVCVQNADGELCTPSGDRIADRATDVCFTCKNILLFRNNGVLYACKDGRTAEKLADRVMGVGVTATAAYYMTVDGEVYASNGDIAFTRVIQTRVEYPPTGYTDGGAIIEGLS